MRKVLRERFSGNGALRNFPRRPASAFARRPLVRLSDDIPRAKRPQSDADRDAREHVQNLRQAMREIPGRDWMEWTSNKMQGCEGVLYVAGRYFPIHAKIKIELLSRLTLHLESLVWRCYRQRNKVVAHIMK